MGSSDKIRLVRRDNRIYDAVKHTFELNASVSVDITMLMSIDDIPSAAQTYIQHKAAETVFLDEDGDVQKLQKLEQRTAFAWQALQAAQLKTISVNALDRNTAQQLNSGWRPGGQGRNPNYIGGRLR
jgi:exopolysaccharide biosynthesis predicted pyruvyltransferase EpsI